MSIVNLPPSFQSSAFVGEPQSFSFTPNPVQTSLVVVDEPQKYKRRFLRKLGSSNFFRVVDNKTSNDFDYSAELFPVYIKSKFNQSFGTYKVHGELLFEVPEFSESPYAKQQPWQDSTNSNWNIELTPFGLYRSFFSNGTQGNYSNFYDMSPSSAASPFYAKSKIPQFYSDEGNCTETTFSQSQKGKEYEGYKPFFVENRGYSRSYFYGSNR
jgi:hypothetical protein